VSCLSVGTEFGLLTASHAPDTREALVRLSTVVSNRCGIVSEVIIPQLEAGDPKLSIAHACPARLDWLTGRDGVNEGSGASLDRDRAMVKALGESVERYCAAFQPPDLPLLTADEIRQPALGPSDFALFSAEQFVHPGFPYVPFTSKTPTKWVTGQSLKDGRDVQVPAPFVYLPYTRHPLEPRICPGISTGLAAGGSRIAATWSALCEVVERDAFMSVWLRRLATPELDLKTLPAGPERELLDILEAAGARCRVRWLTQDVEIPVFLVILEGDGHRMPHAIVLAGGAAHAQPRRALFLALEEACLSLYGMNRIAAKFGSKVRSLDVAQLTSLALQSVAYATRPEFKSACAFLLEKPQSTVSLDALTERFLPRRGDGPAAVLSTWAERAAVVECTTPDVADIGVHVVRVLVPGLLPLNHNHAIRYLGAMEKRLGLSAAMLNQHPHPFP
jgi:ribosomal protein S12 methylthiotransferase accessory factor